MNEQIIKYYPMHPWLKRYVTCYHIWKRAETYTPKQLFLPNNMVGAGFTLSGKLIINTEKIAIEAPAAGTRNVYSKARSIETKGAFYNISIRFKPFGLKAFTKADCKPMFEDECMELEHLFGLQETQQLVEKLQAVQGDAERVQVLEQFLLEHCLDDDNQLIREMITTIDSQNQVFRIHDLATSFGTSERQIHRLFHKYIGISPKAYISLIRFRHFVHLLNTQKHNAVEAALESGYFDQSHFIKEFKSFTSITPQQYMLKQQQQTVSDFYNTSP
jgi:AraC-like DNA-binding protein